MKINTILATITDPPTDSEKCLCKINETQTRAHYSGHMLPTWQRDAPPLKSLMARDGTGITSGGIGDGEEGVEEMVWLGDFGDSKGGS